MRDLRTLAQSKENNFQFIRFVAATGVFLSHVSPLAGAGLGGKAQMLGHVSLNIFFIVSGFLVCKSFIDRPVQRYFLNRALRIFPALIVAVLASAFILGLAMTDLPSSEYLGDPAVYEYVYKNILLFLPEIPKTLPGLFLESKYAPTVNAPLWSLPYEAACYLFLAISGLVFRVKINAKVFTLFAAILFLACFAVYIANQVTKSTDYAIYFGKDTYRLFAMFFMGATLYLVGNKVPISHATFSAFVAIFLASLLYRPASITVFYLICAYSIFYFAYLLKGPLLKFNSLGDYSYGIYIFGYPIQQTVEHLYPSLGLVSYFFVTFSATLFLAALSWHTVEKHALSLKMSK